MKITTFTAAFCLLTLSIIVSCNKPEAPTPSTPPAPPAKANCKVKEVRNADGSLNSSVEEADNKITRIQSSVYSGEVVQAVTYDQDTVFFQTVFAGTTLKQSSKLILGANGYAKKQTLITYWPSGDISYDTTTYVHNAEGYLIKSVLRRPTGYVNSVPVDFEISETTYEILDGNIVKSTFKSNLSSGILEINYEYYTDRENKSMLAEGGLPIFETSFLGKRSKNVVKGSSCPTDNIYNYQYTYEYDDNGYVIKSKYTNPNINPTEKTYTLVYNCN